MAYCQKYVDQTKESDKGLVTLIDIDLYCLIGHRDLEILMFDVLNSEGEEQNLYTRFLVLHLYEFLKSTNNRFGKEFNQLFDEFVPEQKLKDQFRTVQKELSKLNDTYAVKLNNIRNAVIAHKDFDPQTQLKATHDIDPNEIAAIAYAVHQWIVPALDYLALMISRQLGKRNKVILKTLKLTSDF